MVAGEAGLVTRGATRVLSQSPKRCFEELGGDGLEVCKEVSCEETILLVSEIVGYRQQRDNQMDSILLGSNVCADNKDGG